MRNSEKRALRKECRNRKVSVLLERLSKIEIKKWRRRSKPFKKPESWQNLSSNQAKLFSKEKKHKTIDKSNWVFGYLNTREDKFAKELAKSEAKKMLPNFKIPKKQSENQEKSNHITTPISNFKIPKKSNEDKIKEKHLTKEIKKDNSVFKIPKTPKMGPASKMKKNGFATDKTSSYPLGRDKKKNDGLSSKNKRKMGDYFKEKNLNQSLHHSKLFLPNLFYGVYAFTLHPVVELKVP